MMWRKEINKTFGSVAPRFYPGRKAVAKPGYLRGTDVWIATIAIRRHDDGYVCPYCGGEASPDEVYSRVEFTDRKGNLPASPYMATDCTCGRCQNSWIIRANPDTAECVVDFFPPRDPLSGIVRI